MKKHSKYLFATSIAVILAVSLFVLYKNHEHHEPHHATYFVTHPWLQNVDLSNEYVAQIKSIQHIDLRSLEKGYLEKIYVDEGQFVKQGQKMFQIMPLVLQAELDKARAEYNIRHIEYLNTKRLEEKNVVSPNELALAKAKLDKAQANMNLAETHLKFTTVRAPFDGIMDRFRVRLGSLVEEGELLTTISDNRKVWVYFNVSEVDYLDFMSAKHTNKKLPIKLLLANGKYFKHNGSLDTIEADFNNETGNIAFRASFPNPDGLLRHGQTGSVVLSEKITDALVIPQKATFEILDKHYVFVIDKDHTVQSRKIKVLHELPHLYVIQSGIRQSDLVLIEGIGKVKSGDKIHFQKVSQGTVQASLNLPVE